MLTISKGTTSRLLLMCAPLVFLVAALGMMLKREPFYTWFYSFSWWSYLLFIEAFLFSRGHRSLLFTDTVRFLLLLPLSVTIWLVFEAFNFRLQNWHYLCLPPQRSLRWLGYTIAYATVLPAIFSTTNLLDVFGLFRSTGEVAVGQHRMKNGLVWLGIVMLILPVLFPKVFFPLVWLGFIFALEPFNYRNGADSLLRDLEKGSVRMLYLLLLSGFLCGILWECWNFWAGSKWSYTIPYLGFLKVFEMPILGFLGFPFFAVECYVMVNSFFLLLNGRLRNGDLKTQIAIWLLIGIIAFLFDVLVFLGIDAFTVVSFQTVMQ
jgi:hypothetical protein